jgi:hypothetical protein
MPCYMILCIFVVSHLTYTVHPLQSSCWLAAPATLAFLLAAARTKMGCSTNNMRATDAKYSSNDSKIPPGTSRNSISIRSKMSHIRKFPLRPTPLSLHHQTPCAFRRSSKPGLLFQNPWGPTVANSRVREFARTVSLPSFCSHQTTSLRIIGPGLNGSLACDRHT